jgi:hypothetical protein
VTGFPHRGKTRRSTPEIGFGFPLSRHKSTILNWSSAAAVKSRISPANDLQGADMKALLTTVAVAATLASPAAFAQERVADAALGGLSGALVLGPVGAVAGVVIGFTAGPSISRSWGLYSDYRYYPDRVAQRPQASQSRLAAAKQVKSASTTLPKPAPETKPAWNAPPVVGLE